MESQELTKNQRRYQKHRERYAAYAKRPDRKKRASELVKRPEARKRRADYYRALETYRRGAAQRNLPFTLKDEEFHKLVLLPCHYCYAEPNPNNGLDRVDNDEGYTTENCVPCCWMCNHAKGSTPIEEFLPWLARIAAAHGN